MLGLIVRKIFLFLYVFLDVVLVLWGVFFILGCVFF